MFVSYVTISEILLVTALPRISSSRYAWLLPARGAVTNRNVQWKHVDASIERPPDGFRSIITSLVIRCSRQFVCTVPTVAPTRDLNRRLSLTQRVWYSPL